jgi:hypothetical protein
MIPRKPNDLNRKLEKSLRVRYFEVLKLRKLVNEARARIGDEVKIDHDFRRKPRTLIPNRH